MKFERNAASGKRSTDLGDPPKEPRAVPHRRIPRSNRFETCWSDRSKYGTPDVPMTSISSSDRSDGYR